MARELRLLLLDLVARSGAWRVILDAGVTLAAPPPQEGAANLLVPMFEGAMVTLDATGRSASRDALFAMERGTRLTGATPDGGAALRDWVVASTRWVHEGGPALTGRELVGWLNAQPTGSSTSSPSTARSREATISPIPSAASPVAARFPPKAGTCTSGSATSPARGG